MVVLNKPLGKPIPTKGRSKGPISTLPIPPRGKLPVKGQPQRPPTPMPQITPGKPNGPGGMVSGKPGNPVFKTQERQNVQQMAQRGLVRRVAAQRKSVSLGRSRGRGRGGNARYLNQ